VGFALQEKLYQWIQGMSLRWRLTLWYVLLLAITLAVFSAFIYLSLSNSLHHELDALLLSQGEQVVSGLDAENGKLRLDPDLPHLPGTYFSLYNRTGKLLDTNMPASLAASLPVKSLNVNQPETVRARGSEWRVVLLAVKEDKQVRLEVVRSREETERPLDRLLLLIIVTLPLTLIIAAGGGIFLAKRALNPIDQIAAKARHISATDLSLRLGLPHSNDEVGHLVTTLDKMLERLDQAFQRQQQFTSDASHELRTPLAVIRSQAEAALNREHTPEEYRHALEVIGNQSESMGNLVSKLLILARSDNGQEQMDMEPLHLAEMVEGVAGEFQRVAEAKGLHLTTIVADKVVINGDQTWLTHLLANLVDNAIKFTQVGSVNIGLKRSGQWALLWIEDTGAGIPPEHLAHIFERFYRVDKARSRAEGGTGLGLSICEWIAHAHGGKLVVESELGRGTTFKVLLPIDE
jgi:heavy metal sensor kinase